MKRLDFLNNITVTVTKMNEYVWIAPKKGSSEVPIGAHILGVFGPRIKVKDDDNIELWITPEDILRPMHPTSVFGVEDMIQLGDLQEYSILRNLLLRYTKDLIYTYAGSTLVAINPYKNLPIYDKSKMLQYRRKRLGELPPHIYAVADHSYENMRMQMEKRCIVISGESGSGKTESTKFILQYFAHISNKRSGMEQQIIVSNPILEAFGNAKTIRNDNSSRFGKYITLNFHPNGTVQSLQIKQYLLEKSRIVSQNKGEQNYHIFYAILSGMTTEEKRSLGLVETTEYNYLNQPKNTLVGETTPIFHINSIRSAMEILKFSKFEILSIFEIIAAILHFGNVKFEAVSVSNIESAEITSEKELRLICRLLGVVKDHLVDSLIKKTISTHGDNVAKLLSKQQAIDSRDAFVKRIYGNLFNFIVNKVNESLFKNGATSSCVIGVLDIFGFEVFDRNSFEQLCINYANERLQQFFINHIFKAEQEQYNVEGINWKFIDYPDNQDILNLIEGGTTSVLSVINDESKFPQATNQTMLNKLIKFHSENSIFLKPKYKQIPVFGIQHFAGAVLYDVQDFLEKNHDACNLDMKNLIQSSNNKFLRDIFAEDFEADSASTHKKRAETLASKFKNSLDLLMSELNQCQPFFIRCIKPNEIKKPKKFDRMLCSKQLRYSGMTETTRVREAGYPVRYDFVQFVQRYRILCPGTPLAYKTDCKEATSRICKTVFIQIPKADYKLGHTKIFLKHNEELFLERERSKHLYAYAITIQKFVKGWLERRRYYKLKKAVLMLENHWLKRQKYLRNKKIPNRQLLKSRSTEFSFYQTLITQFQARCRGYLIRKYVKNKLKERFKSQIKDFKDKTSTTFLHYAQKHFQGKASHQFTKKPLKNSLHFFVHHKDIVAAKTLWKTILRYTENGKEPKKRNLKIPVRVQLREIFNHIDDGRKPISSVETKSKRKQKEKNADQLYNNWLKTKTSKLEKLYFIVGHGINRPSLRDEIYCQLCKVITKNPSQKAADHAWNLLSSCVGCFPPTDLFLEYLKNFIREGPKEYSPYCLFRLHRTSQNGSRTQPPCHTEFQAIEKQKPVDVKVFLMNEATVPAKIDSATTAKELVAIVAKHTNLKDTFGYSIVLNQEMKHQSLGDGPTFVLDAIAQCEQYAMEIGEAFENLNWKLYLKKEMFSPWYDKIRDYPSAVLTCHQIAKGIKAGDYECNMKDLPVLISKLCFAEHGKCNPLAFHQIINFYIPYSMDNLPAEDLEKFKAEVHKNYRITVDENLNSVDYVRQEIIKYAKKNWALQFSKFFNVVGSLRNIQSTFSYPEVPLLVAVNSSGISIIDESNEKSVIAQLQFMEIREITRKEVTEGNGYILKIISYSGIEISLMFQSEFESHFHKLLMKIIETLKKMSKYVISIKHYRALDKSFLELEKGDLIKLTEKYCGEDLLHNFWAEGINTRTGRIGHFLLDCVEIIPSLELPSQELVTAMSGVSFLGQKCQFSQHIERLKHYTLESYAEKFFRKPAKNEANEEFQSVWKYSEKKIHQPLHVNLINNEKLSAEAVEAFDAILHYANDNHTHTTESDVQTCYKIFNGAIRNDVLKDEIYCQIIKQLTSNTDRENEKKIWELMWMITGLFKCGDILSKEVNKFLQSRRTIQCARECLFRFKKIKNSGPRKQTPHSIEIEAAKGQPCYILYRIYFPNETNKFFKIDSLTKVHELNEIISTRLKINSTGFNLFIQISKRVFALPKYYYIFDYFQLMEKWAKNVSHQNYECQLYFMKQSWKNDSPGLNSIKDIMFIYPQEYNKYIEGFYEIPTEDMVKLAALLYKVYSTNCNSKNFQEILPKLIPSKATALKKPDVWHKDIQKIYFTKLSLSEDECKIEFLKYLFTQPFYGTQRFVADSAKTVKSNYIVYPFTSNSSSII